MKFKPGIKPTSLSKSLYNSLLLGGFCLETVGYFSKDESEDWRRISVSLGFNNDIKITRRHILESMAMELPGVGETIYIYEI